MSSDRLELKIDALDNKLDAVVVELAKQSVILERNTDNLAEHMAQTRLLRERQAQFETYIKVFHRIAGALIAIVGLVIKFFI